MATPRKRTSDLISTPGAGMSPPLLMSAAGPSPAGIDSPFTSALNQGSRILSSIQAAPVRHTQAPDPETALRAALASLVDTLLPALERDADAFYDAMYVRFPHPHVRVLTVLGTARAPSRQTQTLVSSPVRGPLR